MQNVLNIGSIWPIKGAKLCCRYHKNEKKNEPKCPDDSKTIYMVVSIKDSC